MLLRAFTVYDSKVDGYLRPFFMQTPAEAMRAFKDTVNDGQSPISKHPEDYTLFEVGTFDESTGRIEPLDAPLGLGLALNFKDSAPIGDQLFDLKETA